MTHHEAEALGMARMLRRKGYNPIPSYTDHKQPMYRFAAEYGWETPFPAEWFTEEAWEKRPTTNIQCVTGRAWRLLVIDLDGAEAKDVWKTWGKTPRTWITHREDGDSWHLWFRLPENHPEELPKRFLWKGDGKHEAIERLCDRSLIVSPPSFHVEHQDSRYRFLDRDHSPEKLLMPADCPGWVLDRKPIEPEVHRPEFVPPAPKHLTRSTTHEALMSRDELLDRIPDKVALASEWGIRFTGRVSPTGWAECHAITRPDHVPSAAMHIQTGVYTDRGDCAAISFMDTMVATGNALDFRDACARLTERIR